MPVSFSNCQTPLYAQTATLLRRRIEDGTWPAGAQMPTLDDLTGELGVGRVTVRQAMALLEQDGLIERWRGRGTFVAEPRNQAPVVSMTASWEALLEGIEGAKPRLLGSRDAHRIPAFAHRLAGEEKAEILPAYRHLSRVHERKGWPYLLIEIYLEKTLYQRRPKRFDRELVIPLLDAMEDVTIASVRQVLTIGTADLETARHLNIPVNAPVGHMARLMMNRQAQVIYAARLTYRGDLVRLDMKVDPPQIKGETKP